MAVELIPDAFLCKLEKDGHTCAQILDGKVQWCENEVCNAPDILFFNLLTKAHTCVKMDFKTKQVEWCKEEICSNGQDLRVLAMQKEDRKNKELARSLREKGHKCVYEGESMPVSVSYCGQEPCHALEKGIEPKTSFNFQNLIDEEMKRTNEKIETNLRQLFGSLGSPNDNHDMNDQVTSTTTTTSTTSTRHHLMNYMDSKTATIFQQFFESEHGCDYSTCPANGEDNSLNKDLFSFLLSNAEVPKEEEESMNQRLDAFQQHLIDSEAQKRMNTLAEGEKRLDEKLRSVRQLVDNPELGCVYALDTSSTPDCDMEDSFETGRRDMDKRAEERKRLLIEKGHTCVGLKERDPIIVTWCQQETCINSQISNQ